MYRRRLAIGATTIITVMSVLAGMAVACEGGGGGSCTGFETPGATTEEASGISSGAAELRGTVNPHACETTYKFEYGTSTSYGASTAEGNAGSGTGAVAESATITALTPGTTYHFRIVASSLNGTTYGTDKTFKTLSEAPSVTTEEATSIADTGATLNGTVNAKGSETTYDFEYGIEANKYTESTPYGKVTGAKNEKKSATISGLKPETTYHFRMAATNEIGTKYGNDKTFKTLSPTWTIQSTPSPAGSTASRLAFVSCTAANACTSVGEYVNSGAVEVPLGERWNGSSWSAQAPPSPASALWSELLGVSCASSVWCSAVGPYEVSSAHKALAEVWNGTEWAIQTVPNPSGAISSELLSVSCTSSTACTAVGHYTTSSSSATLADRWDGTSWVAQTPPNPSGATESSLLGVSCTSSTSCIAVGYYYDSAGERKTLAESWNGESWSIQTTPNREGATRNILLGVSCTSSSACTAVGGDFPSTGPQETLAERWNGTQWTIQTSQNPSGSEASVLHGVSCISASECTTVGDYVKAGVNVTLAERWNGSSWTIQTTLSPAEAMFSALWSVACTSPAVCVASGYYKNSSGAELALSEKSS